MAFELVEHEAVDLGQVEARPGGTVTTRVIDDVGVAVAGESATLAAPDWSWLRRTTSTTNGRLTFTGVPIGAANLVFDNWRVQPASREVSMLTPTTRVPDAVLPLVVRLYGRLDLPGKLRGDEQPPRVQAALFRQSAGRPVGPAIDSTAVSWHRGEDDTWWADFELDAPPSQRYVVRYSEVGRAQAASSSTGH